MPQLQATVWVGYPKAEIPMENVHGIAVAGGTFPAQIWHEFMQTAVGQQRARDFPPPDRNPSFSYWHRGQYSLGYVPSSPTSSSTASTATSRPATTDAAPATTVSPPTQAPPPTATTAPATTTTEQPPTTTTEPSPTATSP